MLPYVYYSNKINRTPSLRLSTASYRADSCPFGYKSRYYFDANKEKGGKKEFPPQFLVATERREL